MKINKTALLGGSIALALNVGSAQALEFSDTVFFGDSLTDSGAFLGNPDAALDAKFTTSPAGVWAELLAQYFSTSAVANNPLNPNTDPQGTDYAQGGAQVTTPIGIGQTPSPQAAAPIDSQIGFYLDARGQADPNALYSVWGGANDVFFNMGLVGAGVLPPEVAALNMGGSALTLVGEVERLAAAGARYIMVPNIPDIGATPAMVLGVVQAAGAGNPAAGDALVAAATVLALGGADAATVQANALAAAEAALGFPPGSLTPAFQQSAGLASGLVEVFNATLLAATNASSANIINLDTFSLVHEAIANPGEFGLLNVTGTACAVPSSLQCTPATLVDPLAPAVFLFADGVHPTTIGHRVVADYAISVVTAPALIANLPEALLGQTRGHQQALQSHMGMGFGEGWSFFASASVGQQDLRTGQAWDASSDDAGLMAGAALRLSPNWVVGGALQGARSDADFARKLGTFEADSLLVSAFVDFRSDRFFANAIVSASVNSDIDVERQIALGLGQRNEVGSTSADIFAVKATAGMALISNETWQAGPYVGINYQTVDVDGYSERGTRSTSMNFGSQSRDSNLLEGGLFANVHLGPGKLYGAASYESELEDSARTVTAGLNSLPGSQFSLYDIKPSSDYWKLGLGYRVTMGKGVDMALDYTLREGDDNASEQALVLGINIDF